MIIPYITEGRRWDHLNPVNAFPVTMFGGTPAGLQVSDPKNPPAAGMGKGRQKSYGNELDPPDERHVARVRQDVGRAGDDPRHGRHDDDAARHQRNLRGRERLGPPGSPSA